MNMLEYWIGAGVSNTVGNIDATVALQEPKLSPYMDRMRKTLAATMEIEEEDISIKATTTETMGFTGREEGLVAMATCLLTEVNS